MRRPVISDTGAPDVGADRTSEDNVIDWFTLWKRQVKGFNGMSRDLPNVMQWDVIQYIEKGSGRLHTDNALCTKTDAGMSQRFV